MAQKYAELHFGVLNDSLMKVILFTKIHSNRCSVAQIYEDTSK